MHRQTKDSREVHTMTIKGVLNLQSITATFKRRGKGKVTDSLAAYKD
jgi:hypothetical protein